ncbi:hypothetical protein N7510_005255 [Penicillium lagena]|uniref:uncharacterized protein n=1 Tax=Penicillium lagena TaxID=94218 RepID=UPI002540A227|nr:uncharacterized protein N7510_005255 [Penicillium lagena]KAJ5612061.1 hypothetical protein N7510_005255 [Penicillium lagena]
MAGTLPPLFQITDSDHGGYAAVTLYTLLALTITVVVARLFARWFIGRVIHSDDILLAAATILGILQSIFVQLAISNGLGRKISTIENQQLVLYLKYEYAAQILLIATTALSKLSLGLLFKNLMTSRRYSRTNQGLMVVIIAWTIASILALVLRCTISAPWKWNVPDQCINQIALFQVIAALNIITDIGIVVLPCMLLRTVQLSRGKRFRIMALLASRILVCVATGIEVHYTVAMLKSSDIPWENTNSTIWDQVMMNLSIVTTAIPSLGRLVIELQPSVHAFTIHEDPVDGRSASDKRNLSSMRKSLNRDFPVESFVPSMSVQVTSGRRESFKDDTESTEGLVNQPNVIQQTIHFEVH